MIKTQRIIKQKHLEPLLSVLKPKFKLLNVIKQKKLTLSKWQRIVGQHTYHNERRIKFSTKENTV